MKKFYIILICLFSPFFIQAQSFDNFITTKGNQIMDGDKPFRFISYNIPNLNYVEDDMRFTRKHAYGFPTTYEIRDALESIKQMGGRVIRIYTIPVKDFNKPDDVPTFVLNPGEFNERAFQTVDTMLYLANEVGIRIIFPLVNNWQWMGGRPQYAAFRGKGKDDFWTAKQLIKDFKKTIKYVLNRKNTVTGIQYKDDKAILCWETGNELQSPASWIAEIAKYIKKLDKNHLLMDGYYAVNEKLVLESSINDPNIDIVSSHHYEPNSAATIQNIKSNLAFVKNRKPYFVGEVGFISTTAMKQILDLIIQEKGIIGGLTWSLRHHREQGGFYWHTEPDTDKGFKAYHWPGFASGNDYDEINFLQLMRSKSFEIQGLTAPPIPIPQAPKLLSIQHPSKISWQGSVGASSYQVERATNTNGTWITVGHQISDAAIAYAPLFSDRTISLNQPYFYRIKAQNSSGMSDASNVIGPIKIDYQIFVDEMQNRGAVFNYDKIEVATGNDRQYKEDLHRLKGNKGSEAVYYVDGDILGFRLAAFENDKKNLLKLSVSKDNKTYEKLELEPTDYSFGKGFYGYWSPRLYALDKKLEGMRYLKIDFKGEVQLSRIEIDYK